MTREKLKELLVANKVCSRFYKIRGHEIMDGDNLALSLRPEDGKWKVLHYKHGTPTEEHIFSDEYEACKYLFGYMIGRKERVQQADGNTNPQTYCMDRRILKEILFKNKIRSRFYELEDPERAYNIGDVQVLVQEGSKWLVYFSERGNRNAKHYFETEHEACAYLLGDLLGDGYCTREHNIKQFEKENRTLDN